MKKHFLFLGVIGSLLFLIRSQGFCDKNGKVASRDTSELVKKSLAAIRVYHIEKLDIKEKYGIDFSDLEKMSQDEIFQFTEKVVREQKMFTPSNPNEKIVMDRIRKDPTGNIRGLYIYFHREYKGIPIYNTEPMLEFTSDNKMPLYEIPSSDINVSTTASISKEQAVKLVKKHLSENAKEFCLPDSMVDYWRWSYCFPKEQLSDFNSKTKILARMKKNIDIKQSLYADSLTKGNKKYQDRNNVIVQISDTNKLLINTRPRNDSLIEITVKVEKPKVSSNMCLLLRDSVKLFIFPKEEDSTTIYYLAYQVNLRLQDEVQTWIHWVDAKTGAIIFAYKNWVTN